MRRCKRDEVVVVDIFRVNWRRAVGVGEDHHGAGKPIEDPFGIAHRDVAPELWIGEGTAEFGNQLGRGNRIELAIVERTQNRSGCPVTREHS